MEKVSIIIPIYNIAEYIETCVKSLINQTYFNIEIIMIDDGSTDGSSMLCNKLAKQDSRIKLIHQKNNGISVARNRGIEVASGRYIFFIDGDDWIELNTIELLVNLIKKYDADIAAILKENHNESTGEIIIGNGEKMLLHLLDISAVEIWGKLFKRELFENIRFPAGKKHEDLYILPSLLFLASKTVIYQKGYYNYRQRDNSVMGELRKGNINELVECCLFGVNNINNLCEKKSCILEVQKRYFYHILWYYYNVVGIMTDKNAQKIANKHIARFYKNTIKLYCTNPKIMAKDKIRFINIFIKNYLL